LTNLIIVNPKIGDYIEKRHQRQGKTVLAELVNTQNAGRIQGKKKARILIPTCAESITIEFLARLGCFGSLISADLVLDQTDDNMAYRNMRFLNPLDIIGGNNNRLIDQAGQLAAIAAKKTNS
jgi:hypothetical protein